MDWIIAIIFVALISSIIIYKLVTNKSSSSKGSFKPSNKGGGSKDE